MSNMDKQLLNAMRFCINRKDDSAISIRRQRQPEGKYPKWVMELLSNIQLWNGTHPEDLICIDPKQINDKEILARIAQLEENYAK